MTDKTVKYIDLDAVEQPIQLAFTFKGQRHELKPVSVSDFIANTKMLQDMPAEPTLQQEVDFMVTVLTRAFPSMSRDGFLEMPFHALNQLLEQVQTVSGANQVAEEAKADAEANPPTA